ncbi:hypothetical protein KJ603_00525 [Patescibacteria group bacterium]|nr:hypothetical protein [Patescibacteria group bacterium]
MECFDNAIKGWFGGKENFKYFLLFLHLSLFIFLGFATSVVFSTTGLTKTVFILVVASGVNLYFCLIKVPLPLNLNKEDIKTILFFLGCVLFYFIL